MDFTPITDDVRVQCYPFIPLDSEGQMVEASALKTPDGTIINMKDGVRYRNRENEV
ncbi:MAG: hypothetical protein ABW185_23585 [Sedimenticola sp.]